MLNPKLKLIRFIAMVMPLCVGLIVLFLSGACSGPATNVATTSEQSILIPYRKGGKWGYSDINKKLVIEAKYQSAEPFFDDLARVCQPEGCGFIDKTGKAVIPLIWNEFHRLANDSKTFTAGLTRVELDDKWGFIDKAGNVVVPIKYHDIRPFSEGLAQVELQFKWGYVDKTGKEVIPLKYDNTEPFSEGLASVGMRGKKPQAGFIDATGKEVIPMKFGKTSSFSDGLGIVCAPKCGFIDKSGKQVTPLKYTSVTVLSDGMGPVEYEFITRLDANSTETRIGSGYVGKTGKEVIPVGKYDYAGPFSEGLACVGLNGKYGYIDTNGNEIIPLRYSSGKKIIFDPMDQFSDSGFDDYRTITGAFSEGLAAVVSDKKWGYIDKSGNQIVAFKYDHAYPFSGGLALVEITRPADNSYHPQDFGYIGTDGTEYFEP